MKSLFSSVQSHVRPISQRIQETPGMALRVVGLHGGAAHIAMVFEGKAMHLGSEKTLGKKGKPTW